MSQIIFRTEVNGEQVIRPPADVILPEGILEVTVRPVGAEENRHRTSRDAANARLRESRVSIGHATGIDNELIDADLARAYGDEGGDNSGEARG